MLNGNRKDETTDFHDNDGCFGAFVLGLIGVTGFAGLVGWVASQWL